MQRPSGSACCSRPCQLQHQPAFCPARISNLKAEPGVHSSSRTSRVYGTARDEAGTGDKGRKAIKASSAVQDICLLLDQRTRLQAALITGPLQLIGGLGVCLYAFGDFTSLLQSVNVESLSSRLAFVCRMVLLNAYSAILRGISRPMSEYKSWKSDENKCVKYWDSGLVDYSVKSHGCVNRPSGVLTRSSKYKNLTDTDLEHCDLVEHQIQDILLTRLSDNHKILVEALKWGVIELVGAFVLYKGLVQKSSPYHLACLQLDSVLNAGHVPSLWALCFLVALFQFPVMAIGRMINAFVKLKVQERICEAWCGDESIKQLAT